MTLERDTRVFFDASCLFTAADSPTGGSAFLLSVCQRGFLQAVASLAVLLEAENNILDKRPQAVFIRYRQLLAQTPFLIISAPSAHDIAAYHHIFLEDDHVIAAAIASQAPFLLTLDKRLERRIAPASLPISALAPKEFIQNVLPTHRDYQRIR